MTREQAIGLKKGQIIYSILSVDSFGCPLKWKVNGKSRIWKKSNKFIIPIRYQYAGYSKLTMDNIRLFLLTEEKAKESNIEIARSYVSLYRGWKEKELLEEIKSRKIDIDLSKTPRWRLYQILIIDDHKNDSKLNMFLKEINAYSDNVDIDDWDDEEDIDDWDDEEDISLCDKIQTEINNIKNVRKKFKLKNNKYSDGMIAGLEIVLQIIKKS